MIILLFDDLFALHDFTITLLYCDMMIDHVDSLVRGYLETTAHFLLQDILTFDLQTHQVIKISTKHDFRYFRTLLLPC